MPAEFIYTTYKLARHYPPDRTVLENISISFYPGAKIGVIGPNGAGKSSLLRIMAGLDDGFTGEARLTPGLHRRLPAARSPQLDPTKDVKGNVMDGVAEVQALIDAVQRGHGQVVRPRRRLRGDRRRAGRPRGQDRRGRRLEPRAQRRHRDGRPALPARRRRRHDPVRRREAPRRAGPAPPPAPRPAPPRRADQPPRRRVGRLARALPPGVRGHGRRDHPRPLLPRQRRAVDPRARPRPRHPVRGQLLGLARAEARRAWRGEEKPADARQRTLARELEWVRMGAAGPPGQGQGPPGGYEKLLAEANDRQGRRRASSRSRSRPGRASATRSSRSRTCARATATGSSSRT